VTKKEAVQKIIERTTSRIKKPNPKDYKYVSTIRCGNEKMRHDVLIYSFLWTETKIIRKLLELNYVHNNISNIDGAPSLDEVINQNLFDIEKFECGGTQCLERYSDKSD